MNADAFDANILLNPSRIKPMLPRHPGSGFEIHGFLRVHEYSESHDVRHDFERLLPQRRSKISHHDLIRNVNVRFLR